MLNEFTWKIIKDGAEFKKRRKQTKTVLEKNISSADPIPEIVKAVT